MVILRRNQLIRHPVKRLNFLLIQQRFGHLDCTRGLASGILKNSQRRLLTYIKIFLPDIITFFS